MMGKPTDFGYLDMMRLHGEHERKTSDSNTTSELFRITKNQMGQFRLERALVYNGGGVSSPTKFDYFSGPFSTLALAKQAKNKAEITSPYNVWTPVSESEE